MKWRGKFTIVHRPKNDFITNLPKIAKGAYENSYFQNNLMGILSHSGANYGQPSSGASSALGIVDAHRILSSEQSKVIGGISSG